ncbi:MAG: polyprenol monophosphomannose synthase [Acidimicrobiales bacterium]|nr:polyprenol monophosphomannose synthase [Acidimicrobiales bacterium]
MRTLVVLPTYNEALNIEEVLRKVREALPDTGILIVDDDSPDGTADIAESFSDELGPISVLRRSEKSGLGSAYRAGFRWGIDNGYEIMVEMDSDLSHDPKALPELVKPFDDGYELIVGSRYVSGGTIPNWKWHRRLLSRGGNLYAQMALGVPIKDSTAGYRAYSAKLLDAIDLTTVKADGYGFQIEMTYRSKCLGAKMGEVPISFRDRERGTSKMSLHITVEALLLVTKWGLERLIGKSPKKKV